MVYSPAGLSAAWRCSSRARRVVAQRHCVLTRKFYARRLRQSIAKPLLPRSSFPVFVDTVGRSSARLPPRKVLIKEPPRLPSYVLGRPSCPYSTTKNSTRGLLVFSAHRIKRPSTRRRTPRPQPSLPQKSGQVLVVGAVHRRPLPSKRIMNVLKNKNGELIRFRHSPHVKSSIAQL